MAETWSYIPNLAPILFLDDLRGLLSFLPLTRQSEVLKLLQQRIDTGTLKIVAIMSTDAVMELMTPPLAGESLNYRGQFINLQPLPPHLMRMARGSTAQISNLVSNVAGCEYRPGEGLMVARGKRREIKIFRSTQVARIVDDWRIRVDTDEL